MALRGRLGMIECYTAYRKTVRFLFSLLCAVVVNLK
jgi:hypothetical protein